jgi:hypothetical protein
MKRNGRYRTFQLCIYTSLLFLMACAPAVATPAPGLVETIVAATVQALPTLTPQPTATMTPAATSTRVSPTPIETETPFPSLTPMPTFTDTPTETPTPTPTSDAGPEGGIRQGGSELACVVLSRTPAGEFKSTPGREVSVTWRIRNVGTSDWRADSVDYVYFSGQKMSAGPEGFDFQRTIPAGQEVDITVRFAMPGSVGTYTTTWALVAGSNAFCKFSFTAIVE